MNNNNAMDNPIIKRIFQLKGIEWITIIFFIVLFPFLIALLQFVLIKVIIPLDIPPEFVTLLSEKPTISGMFFANYFHSISDSDHLINNYISTIFAMGLIVGMIFIVLPAYNIKISQKSILKVFFLLLFILPFIISAITLYFSMVTKNPIWGYGFSGITSSLLGFGLFLVLWYFFEITLKENYYKDKEKVILGLLSVTILFCFFPPWIMFFQIGGNVNVFAHIMGYSFGLITPALIGLK